MNQRGLFDEPPAPAPPPPSGRQLRDEAMTRVVANERLQWQLLHDRELQTFLAEKGDEPFQTEDFRAWFGARGNPAPHSPNVWGAMWNNAARVGLIEKTGRRVQMKVRTSHARETAEWRRRKP